MHELTQEVYDVWSQTVSLCASLGAQVVKVSLPHTSAALAAYYILAPAESSSNLARYDGVRFGTRASLDDEKSHDDFHEEVSRTRTMGFGTEVQRRILIGTYTLCSERTARYFSKAQQVRQLVSDDFRTIFGDVHVLLTPTSPTCAPRMADLASLSAAENYATDIMTVPASLAGLPAVSLPLALGAVSKLPVGMQFIGERYNDAMLLRIAATIEASLESGVLGVTQ